MSTARHPPRLKHGGTTPLCAPGGVPRCFTAAALTESSARALGAAAWPGHGPAQGREGGTR